LARADQLQSHQLKPTEARGASKNDIAGSASRA